MTDKGEEGRDTQTANCRKQSDWRPGAAAAIMHFPTTATATLKINDVTTTRTVPDATSFNALTDSGNDDLYVEIFDRMVSSTDTFGFEDNNHAAQHFLVRKRIVETIGRMKTSGIGIINFGYGSAGNFTFPTGFESKTGGGQMTTISSKRTRSRMILKAFRRLSRARHERTVSQP